MSREITPQARRCFSLSPNFPVFHYPPISRSASPSPQNPNFVMPLPYNRPRFIELHEQTWFPSFLRQPIQTMLTTAWTTRFPIFQAFAPCEAVSDTLERVVDCVEEEDRLSGKEGEGLRIVDCCSGAGGPISAIERRLKWGSPSSPGQSLS
jgi:hypothetical protein